MLFPNRCSSRPAARCPPTLVRRSVPIPTVTSVTSVRCFPNWCSSRPAAAVSTNFGSPISPNPLCDLRDLCAMLSPIGAVLAQPPRCPSTLVRRSPSIPTVTSVTSVRCFPPIRAVLAQPPRCPPTLVSSISPNPLCDLRDLCAMLFPNWCSSRPAAAVSINFGSPISLNALCDLRDLCAMLFPDSCSSRPAAAVSTNFGSPIRTDPPL